MKFCCELNPALNPIQALAAPNPPPSPARGHCPPKRQQGWLQVSLIDSGSFFHALDLIHSLIHTQLRDNWTLGALERGGKWWKGEGGASKHLGQTLAAVTAATVCVSWSLLWISHRSCCFSPFSLDGGRLWAISSSHFLMVAHRPSSSCCCCQFRRVLIAALCTLIRAALHGAHPRHRLFQDFLPVSMDTASTFPGESWNSNTGVCCSGAGREPQPKTAFPSFRPYPRATTTG